MQRTWVRETAGWLGAGALAVIVAAQVASTARAELLFRDGDSLVVALFADSVLSAAPLDWAMSSVLFLPETAVFAALDAVLPLDLNSLLAVCAVVNLMAVYGALRLAAGRRRSGAAPVAWALIATAAFGALAMTEASPSRDALELASLQLTTTYYSATVVAVIAAVGLTRRALDADRRPVAAFAGLGVVAAASALTNPLFAAWATVPLTLLLLLALRDVERRGRVLMLLALLLTGTGLGLLVRIPFSAWIANAGVGYARPAEWMQALGYYGGLLAERLSAPLGVVSALLTLALLALAIRNTARARGQGARLVAAAGWMLPLLVVIGGIALGTHAARYLQPVAFAPLLGLVALPRTAGLPRRLGVQLVSATAVVLLAAASVSLPRLSAAAQAPDRDLGCVTDWVEGSGRIGAGQFWTVRLPKAHLDDSALLVQVDHRLNAYAWLVNRTDFVVGEVSFLVEDAQTVPWDLPVSAVPEEIVDCGRYRILDFGAQRLPLGPQRS
ncbi:hypothetical protein [Microbacterium hydrocarbonoxydans]|uniref:hypothetical protein n=1 Tax=Microbacterium hydrocarbonoxydans TaxID=273678 RepID=UPI0013DBC3F8|nr:hypothetical protein [Microbacterium hydrocarbonoxydans]